MASSIPIARPLEYRHDRAAFGRHQTFPLRYAWLSKGFQAFGENPGVFEADDATVALGVGSNMVKAMLYWLLATGMLERTPEGLAATALGTLLFGPRGLDPWLEDEGTLWLLHWQLATNGPQATAWRWFFNEFHLPEFSLTEASQALEAHARDRLRLKSIPRTLSNDLRILLRMYEPPAPGRRTSLEDALDTPLSALGLVQPLPDRQRHRSAAAERAGPPDAIFAFVVATLVDQIGRDTLPLGALMYGHPGFPALGAAFRLTENALLTKLERFVRQRSTHYALREQAGIHQLYRLGSDTRDPLDELRAHYRPVSADPLPDGSM